MALTALIPIVGELIDRVVPDADKKIELKLELAKLADAEAQREHEQLIEQTEVNKIEAGHRSIFVAGWRPAIGWGCGAALVYNTMVAPMFNLGQADLGFLQAILMGMLGLAGMRSFDKVKGVANDYLPLGKKEVLPSTPIPAKERKKGLDLWPF